MAQRLTRESLPGLFVFVACCLVTGNSAQKRTNVRIADQFAGANGGAKIQAAINDCPASGCTVLVPAGTYDVASYIRISGKTRFNLILDKGATIRAAAGFPAGNPLLQAEGGSTDVRIEGGTFDANHIAGMGIQVGGLETTRVRIRGVEVKNTAPGDFQPGISVAPLAAGGYEAEVSNSYIHDTYHACIHGQFPGTLRAINNRCENSSNGHGIAAGGLQRFVVIGNKISGISEPTTANGVYCFGCDAVEWRANEVKRSSHGMHCDTCGAADISRNIVDAIGVWGIFAETSTGASITGNKARNTGLAVASTGILIGGTGPRSLLRTSVNSLDSTGDLTAAANVTLSIDTDDRREGKASVQAAVGAAFAGGKVFYQDHGVVNHNWFNPFRDLWIKSDKALAAGQLSLGTTLAAGCASFDRVRPIPAVPAGKWVRLSLYFPSWQYDTGPTRGIRCWAIIADRDPGAVILKFDDLAAARHVTGNIVARNRVFRPNGPCYDFGHMDGGQVRNNDCEDPDFRSRARRAYTFSHARNPVVAGNRVNFKTKTAAQVAQFLVLDAHSSVIDRGNRGTNVDAYSVVPPGGKLLGKGRRAENREYPP